MYGQIVYADLSIKTAKAKAQLEEYDRKCLFYHTNAWERELDLDRIETGYTQNYHIVPTVFSADEINCSYGPMGQQMLTFKLKTVIGGSLVTLIDRFNLVIYTWF